MKITGYQLREAIRTTVNEVDDTFNVFKDSVFQFEGDDYGNPLDRIKEHCKATDKLAKLQCLQQQYNSMVEINVRNQQYTLAYAIKIIAYISRQAKTWKMLSVQSADERWGGKRDLRRNKDDEFAKRTIDRPTCVKKAVEANQLAGEFRNAIAIANNQEIELKVEEGIL